MIIVMRPNASRANITAIEELLTRYGLQAHISQGSQTAIIGIVGDKTRIRDINLDLMPGVDKLVPVMESYKLASRSFKPANSQVEIGGVSIGGPSIAMMAGPCAVESEEQMMASAKAVKAAGAHFLRGGAYKPRTSPYSFQGLEDEGYRLLQEAANEYGLKVISEVISESSIEVAGKYCDMFQIGARNMSNFRLLKEIGRSGVPVLLKRGNSSTVTEWLDAAEYIMNEGNYNVVLCERGIRTFETATRNTLDLSAVAVVKEKSHLPVIVDPSHAVGKAAYVENMSLAAIAAGADGLIIEVHPDPRSAMSDAAQQLSFPEFATLSDKVRAVAKAVGRDWTTD